VVELSKWCTLLLPSTAASRPTRHDGLSALAITHTTTDPTHSRRPHTTPAQLLRAACAGRAGRETGTYSAHRVSAQPCRHRRCQGRCQGRCQDRRGGQSRRRWCCCCCCWRCFVPRNIRRRANSSTAVDVSRPSAQREEDRAARRLRRRGAQAVPHSPQ
jgi:hypothetical protein